MVTSLAIALCLAVLAWLNLAGAEAGRIATWIVQPILLVAGGWVTGSQVYVVRHVEWAIKDVDVKSFIAAAQTAFPRWVRPLIVVRFLLTTVGSVLILAALVVTQG